MNLLRKVTESLLPWAPKHERQAAIEAARRERERSEADVAKAWGVAQDLRRLTSNHYAAEIAQQILGGHHANRE